MKKIIILLSAIFLIIQFTSKAQQVPLIQMSRDANGNVTTSFAGKIDVSDDFQAFENNSFVLTPIQPLMRGDVLAATGSEGQAWSANTVADRLTRQDIIEPTQDNKVAMLSSYPVVGMVTCSNGNFCIIYPALLKVKVNIPVGKELYSGGYQIKANRSVKAGEYIPVLVINSSILSVKGTNGKPWFIAFKGEYSSGTRAAMLEAWRLEKKHVDGYTDANEPAQYDTQTNVTQKTVALTAKDWLDNAFKKEGDNDYKGAIVAYNHAIALDSKDELTIRFRGETKFRFGHYADAITDFDHAITLDQKDYDVYSDRGKAKIKLGRYIAAIADFSQAITLSPNSEENYIKRGEAKDKLGHHEDAKADYNQAIAIDTKFIVSGEFIYLHYCTRGDANIHLGRYEDAIADFDHVIAHDKDSNAEAYDKRGYAYYKLGNTKANYQRAIADYDTCIYNASTGYKPDYQYRDEAVAAKNKAIEGALYQTPDDWQQAKSSNTIAAYWQYLRMESDKSHTAEAREGLKSLVKAYFANIKEITVKIDLQSNDTKSENFIKVELMKMILGTLQKQSIHVVANSTNQVIVIVSQKKFLYGTINSYWHFGSLVTVNVVFSTSGISPIFRNKYNDILITNDEVHHFSSINFMPADSTKISYLIPDTEEEWGAGVRFASASTDPSAIAADKNAFQHDDWVMHFGIAVIESIHKAFKKLPPLSIDDSTEWGY